MKYAPPCGAQDPDAGYVTGRPGQTKGSPVPAEAVECPQREIVNCIKSAGLEPDGEDMTQLAQAVIALIAQKATGVATLEKTGTVKPDGVTISIAPDGTISLIGKQESVYQIGEPYFFLNPVLRDGFRPAYGGLIENAASLYPEAWAYFQTENGRRMCVTEAEWQAMSTKIEFTAADGTTDGWNGVGGVPKFVQDLDLGTLRVPDLRGMYPEAAGFDGLDAGGVHGPGLPNITGGFEFSDYNGYRTFKTHGAYGAFKPHDEQHYVINQISGGYTQGSSIFLFDASLSNHIYGASTTVRPRSFGVLPCVFLGS